MVYDEMHTISKINYGMFAVNIFWRTSKVYNVGCCFSNAYDHLSGVDFKHENIEKQLPT